MINPLILAVHHSMFHEMMMRFSTWWCALKHKYRIIQGQAHIGLPKSNQTGNVRRSDKDSVGPRGSERKNHGDIKLFGL